MTLVGTIKKNKREIPASFKKISEDSLNAQFYFADGKVLVSYNPKKKKIVLLLSSLHTNGAIDSQSKKSEIILFYNKTKEETDTFDQKCHQ